MKKFITSTILVSTIALALSACQVDTNSSSDSANDNNNQLASSKTQNTTLQHKQTYHKKQGSQFTSTSTTTKGNSRLYTSFMKFVDIPMPSDSRLDLDHTLVMGGATNWIGRLSLNAPYKMSKMFDFYQKNMADFGWRSLSTMRAESSVLTYQYNQRIATVTLSPVTMGTGTRVQFTISPESKRVNTLN